MTMIRLVARILVLAAIACASAVVYALPGDRHVHPCAAEGRTMEHARQGTSAVRATGCRPVRHGPTTGVHVTVLRQ